MNPLDSILFTVVYFEGEVLLRCGIPVDLYYHPECASCEFLTLVIACKSPVSTPRSHL